MSATEFNRDDMAKWYATQHFSTDPRVKSIFYLTKNSPDREIRFLEVNELMAERSESFLEPVDFGVDIGSDSEHKLFVLDVTPAQWQLIRQRDPALPLPKGWSLDQYQELTEMRDSQ